MEIGRPEPGFYRTRLVKGGPYVAAEIVIVRRRLDRPARLAIILDGTDWSRCPLRMWTFLEPIGEAEFRYLIAMAKHCRTHEPWAPEANPRRPVDLNEIPTLF